jgi:CBS domain containing-hemolysin-like protein
MPSIEIEIVMLIVLLMLSALFSGTEAAFISLDRIKLRRMLKKGARNAKKVVELRKNSDRVLSALLIGNNLVNVLASVFATTVMLKLFANYAIGIATGLMTFLILVFGEITPKRLAIKHAEFIMSLLANKIAFFTGMLRPLIWVIEKFAGIVLSVFGGGNNEKLITEEEVKGIISLGAEEGAINKREQEMIHRIFRLDDIRVEEVMTPRVEIVAVEQDRKLDEIAPMVKKSAFSRMPVYKQDMDHIVGILYAKDALKYLAEGKGRTKVSKLMKEAYFIPETKKIDKLLAEFQDRREHIAVVVDEYAVNGNASIREINEVLLTRYNQREFETVAGMIMSKVDRIPKKNEKVIVGNIDFIVKELKGPKIKEVIVIDRR